MGLIRGEKCSDDKIFLNSSLARLCVAPGEQYQHYSPPRRKIYLFSLCNKARVFVMHELYSDKSAHGGR